MNDTVSSETESKWLWFMCHTCVNDLLKHKRSLRTASPEWDMKRLPEECYHVINLRRCQSLLKHRNVFRVIITVYKSTGSCGFAIERKWHHVVLAKMCSLRGINSILKFDIARRMRRNS